MFAEMLQIDQQQLICDTSPEFAGSPKLSPQFQRLGERGTDEVALRYLTILMKTFKREKHPKLQNMEVFRPDQYSVQERMGTRLRWQVQESLECGATWGAVGC